MEYTIRPVNVPFSLQGHRNIRISIKQAIQDGSNICRQICRITLGLRLRITSGTKQFSISIVSNIETLIARSHFKISWKYIFENCLSKSLTSLSFSPGLPVLLFFYEFVSSSSELSDREISYLMVWKYGSITLAVVLLTPDFDNNISYLISRGSIFWTAYID